LTRRNIVGLLHAQLLNFEFALRRLRMSERV
jgi:hypothetical protein